MASRIPNCDAASSIWSSKSPTIRSEPAGRARRGARRRPRCPHLTALWDAAKTTYASAGAVPAAGPNHITSTTASLLRGVCPSVTRKLSVHQRIGFRRSSGQGLRPDLGRHPRRLHRQRRQARHRRRQPINTRLGCETLATTNKIVIAGEGRGQLRCSARYGSRRSSTAS